MVPYCSDVSNAGPSTQVGSFKALQPALQSGPEHMLAPAPTWAAKPFTVSSYVAVHSPLNLPDPVAAASLQS